MQESTLACHHIAKSFTTGKITQQVIRDTSIDIYPGEVTLIVGPSGSGKSTILAVMSGLMRPDSGDVRALGNDLWQLDEAQIDSFRLANCGFVFQGFNLFGALTALENVMLPLKYLNVGDGEMTERARQALDEVGLDRRAHLRPIELSGGEKQRTAIARALVKRPRLIFADEPTSALDSTNGQIVIDLLHKISREHGTTILGVTHDPRLLSHADRVIRLEDGAVTGDERIDKSSPTSQEN